MSTKKANKRLARKRSLRSKYSMVLSKYQAFRDGMSASRRGYGRGIGR